MLVLIAVENGVKKIIPLTADAGAGNPVGTIIVVCSNQIPSNYLPLGTQYDTSLYPVLYALLGTDTTPTASALGLPTLTSGQYAIKATSGLSENAQDNVINTLNEQRSYSKTEQLTGEKWISGQPIYRKTIGCGYLPNAGNKTVAHNISGFDQAIKVFGVATSASGNNFPLPYVTLANELNISLFVDKTNVELSTGSDRSAFYCYVTIEYTKTV